MENQLVLKSDLRYEGPQSMQQSFEQLEENANNQNKLINATSLRGGKRRRYRMRGGDNIPPYPDSPPKDHIEVQPLPMGLRNSNMQENNVLNAKVYATAVENASGDKYIGGKRRMRTTRKKKTMKKKRNTKKSYRKKRLRKTVRKSRKILRKR